MSQKLKHHENNPLYGTINDSPVEAVSISCSLTMTVVSFSSSSANSLPLARVKNTEGMLTVSEPLPLMERGCDKLCGISLLSREADEHAFVGTHIYTCTHRNNILGIFKYHIIILCISVFIIIFVEIMISILPSLSGIISVSYLVIPRYCFTNIIFGNTTEPYAHIHTHVCTHTCTHTHRCTHTQRCTRIHRHKQTRQTDRTDR